MIKASSKLFAVIGDPIAHSLSPVMQNWMIEQFGLNAIYVAFHIRNQQLQSCLQAVRTLDIGGLNVTVPHKETILPFVDSKTPDVELLQAANTIKNDKGNLQAHVTDPYGFSESLGPNRERFSGANVLLFGAGGAARSICYALSQMQITVLTISDIALDKAEELMNLAVNRLHIANVQLLIPGDPDLQDHIRNSEIIINATAVGMHPHTRQSVIADYRSITRRHFVFDVIYNPEYTELLINAKIQGATVQNGLDMLIYQGLQSLRIFTDEQQLALSSKQLAEVQKIMNQELRIYE